MTKEIKKKKPVLVCNTPSRTQQHFKTSCDINNIYNSYCKNNTPMPFKSTQPRYGEISVKSILEAKELIETVENEFYQLPADIRAKFDNDISKLVNFVGNSSNYDSAVALGLIPHDESRSAKSEPSPDHLSLIGEGDTIKSENVPQTSVSIDVPKNE